VKTQSTGVINDLTDCTLDSRGDPKVSPPNGVTISTDDRTIVLSWRSVSNAQGYNIYRSTKENTGFFRINDNPVSQTQYLDHDVDYNNTYYYRIKTVKGTDESLSSQGVNATVIFPVDGSDDDNGVGGETGALDSFVPLILIIIPIIIVALIISIILVRRRKGSKDGAGTEFEEGGVIPVNAQTQSSHQAPTSTQTYQAPAQSQYFCQTCRGPLSFIQQYNRWYCHNLPFSLFQHY
jgi:hypothetical protein